VLIKIKESTRENFKLLANKSEFSSVVEYLENLAKQQLKENK